MAAQMVYIILVNWNNGKDTVECLQSIKEKLQLPFRLLLLDNGSTDQSASEILIYLKSESKFFHFEHHFLDQIPNNSHVEKPAPTLQFIQSKSNLGFAEGNNKLIEFALQDSNCSHVWLLNNDTIVTSASLSSLLTLSNSKSKLGICGSILVYNHKRNKIQAIGGGHFYPLLGNSKLYGKNMPLDNLDTLKKIPTLDYIMGASLLVKREMMEEVGLMDSAFFVYVEEVDWAHRAKALGWKIAVALDSIVYHKDQGSTRGKSHQYYYLLNKHNMMFIKKHYGLVYSLIALIPALINLPRKTFVIKNIISGIKGLFHGIGTEIKH